MPSSKGYVRKLKQEAKTGKKRGDPARRKVRNQARAAAIKKHGKAALKGKDIGHNKKGAKGGTKIQSVKSNRAHGGRIGSRAGKAAGGRKGMAKRWGSKKK